MNGSRRWHLALFLVLLARVCRATESDIEEVQDGNLPRVASCEEGIGGELVREDLPTSYPSSLERHGSAAESGSGPEDGERLPFETPLSWHSSEFTWVAMHLTAGPSPLLFGALMTSFLFFAVLNPGNQTVQGSRCYKRRIVLVDGTERVGRTSRWQLPKYHRVKDSGYFFHSLRIHVRIAHKGWTSSKVRFCIHR